MGEYLYSNVAHPKMGIYDYGLSKYLSKRMKGKFLGIMFTRECLLTLFSRFTFSSEPFTEAKEQTWHMSQAYLNVNGWLHFLL